MDRSDLERLTGMLLAGEMPAEQFINQLVEPTTAAFDEVTLDLDRQRRCGFPEVVYGAGKRLEALIGIFHKLLENGLPVLATRIEAGVAERLQEHFPQGNHNPLGRTFRIAAEGRATPIEGNVAVVTAGSSDLPVAEEVRETLDWMGVAVDMIHDVGVAGPHRLPVHVERLRKADAIVVAAGMEGALPSVVGGYVDCPVIAVPTSVGYGASFAGVAALLGMLNSCAANVTVVNIDAGFKAGFVAGLIARKSARN